MNSKVTFQLASEIRILYREGKKQIDIAAKYGVCQATVSSILANKAWYDPLHKVIPKARRLTDEVVTTAYWETRNKYTPIREIAEELGVNYRTLERRMVILKRQGLLNEEPEHELPTSSVSSTDGSNPDLRGDGRAE